jgi:hypothetical protein
MSFSRFPTPDRSNGSGFFVVAPHARSPSVTFAVAFPTPYEADGEGTTRGERSAGMDAKVRNRLLKVLRMGASDHANEADTAFATVLRIMDENGISIEALLETLKPNDVPQHVIAELARRYCFSRPDKSNNQMAEYYGEAFDAIAEKYTARPKPKPEGPHRGDTRSREETPGSQRPEEPEGGSDDWIRRMDEARRKHQAEAERQAREAGARERADLEERMRRMGEENEALRRERSREMEAAEARRWKFLGSRFFSDALSRPAHTVRLFLACCLYGLPRALGVLLLLGAGFQELGIHTFDRLNWIDALTILLFPFTIKKGIELYRAGWYC